MSRILHSAKAASNKSVHILKTEGPASLAKRSAKYVYYRKFSEKKGAFYKDILFINGCALPHPARYRVDHQIEQLQSHGLTADSVFYERLRPDMLKYYRGFVFFRCPITNTVKEFIEQAKLYHKTCFFDIDDLVIDQKYTDLIEYVQNMPKAEKTQYDDGVNRMRATLEMCDYAITTTERLQEELRKYTKEVFINRNLASDEMVGRSISALKQRKMRKNAEQVTIGYFSGSITHNEDFSLVLPSLVKLLEKHKNLYMKIAGMLDVPASLKPFKTRIINIEFMDWRTMPQEIVKCDINIAPLTDNIFNEAKSENKWTEASLVKVVTAASNIGAFRTVIKNGKTGILVDDNKWYEALDELILDSQKRNRIAEAAYKDVLEGSTTISAGQKLTNFIKSKLARNIAFVLPSTEISGGVNVALKHADILRRNGWDVTLVDALHKSTMKSIQKQYTYRYTIPGYNVVTLHKTKIDAYFDTMVATLWSTLSDIKKHPNTKNKLYFVQSMETDFYAPGTTPSRVSANATYCDDTSIRYITMSLWCQEWLKNKFGKDAKYASNGIDLQNYPIRQRDFSASKIKILIEGDSSSEYKNVDEAFRIIEKLDPGVFEVSYLSYLKEPKDWYRVDHFYNRIAPEKVGKVYADCDILLKTSLLESFSYPPLEMMATGGVSVMLPNDGNVEYARNGYNCLFYKMGDIEDGVSKIKQVVDNEKLRKKLIRNGLGTAKEYKWEHREKSIIELYE